MCFCQSIVFYLWFALLLYSCINISVTVRVITEDISNKATRYKSELDTDGKPLCKNVECQEVGVMFIGRVRTRAYCTRALPTPEEKFNEQ